MISCTVFIPDYSELFKYLERRGGKQTVLEFWEYLSDKFLDNLRDLVKEHGIEGCWKYWSHTLNEEAADFTMELDTETGEFKILMDNCPSKGRFEKETHITPYHDYCVHCDVLYRRVLEPLGLECSMDLSECDKSKCDFVVRIKK